MTKKPNDKQLKVDRFWMVLNPKGRMPAQRHYSRESADYEAQRLAAAHSGTQYFVLKVVGGFVVPLPKPDAIRVGVNIEDEVPF